VTPDPAVLWSRGDRGGTRELTAQVLNTAGKSKFALSLSPR
jgi:hypothetical protein